MPFRYTGDYYRRAAGDYYTAQGGLALAAFAAPILKRAAKPIVSKAGPLLGKAVRFLRKPVTTTRAGATAYTATAAGAAYRAGKRAAAREAAERLLGKDEECPPRKRRRMNVANPRALRRAIRRAQGFARLARKVLTFTSARAPRGRAKFKRRR